ncbi:MAG: hypothetical protein E7265_03570 [Lachnospiraceae bacterium]|nr:hypothetical protein [Lachnospiraceae bacterium]
MSSKSSHKHHSRKYYRGKGIVSFLIALIVAMSTAIMLLAITVNLGICDVDILKRSINAASYYDGLYEKVNNQLKEQLKEADIPDSIAEGVVDWRRIVLDVDAYIEQTLNNNDASVDTSEFENALSSNIASYFSDKGVEGGQELADSTDKFVKIASARYASLVRFEYADYFKAYSEKYKGTAKVIVPVCGAVIVICLMMLLILHRKKYRGIRYVNYGLISGVVLAIIVNTLFKDSVLKSLPDSQDSYYNVIRLYIDNSFSQGLYVCMAGFVVLLVMLMITSYMRKNSI